MGNEGGGGGLGGWGRGALSYRRQGVGGRGVFVEESVRDIRLETLQPGSSAQLCFLDGRCSWRVQRMIAYDNTFPSRAFAAHRSARS